MNLQLGYDIDGKELDDLFTRFKAVAGNKKVLMFLLAVKIYQDRLNECFSYSDSKVGDR